MLRPNCVLHVAALPFPNAQGTQAALHAMLSALAEGGVETHLLCYAHGQTSLAGRRDAASPHTAPTYTVHRIADFPRVRSLRSGPSMGKVALDLQLVFRLRALSRALKPDLVVAHHVEAAAAALAAGVRPWVFFAHTDLGEELPSYLPGSALVQRLGTYVGGRFDATLLSRTDGVLAIGPGLAQRLRRHGKTPVHAMPPPWACAHAITKQEREAARRRLGLGVHGRVLLYAGNLDAYQGWEMALDAAARVADRHDDVTLLVASMSDPAPVLRYRERHAPALALRVHGLANEQQRRWVHAAADLAMVPRRAPGGLPVKLLDAMSRGVPVITTPRALAGLPLDDAACIAADDDVDRLFAAALRLLDDASERSRLSSAGPAYIRTHHSPNGFLCTWRAAMQALNLPSATSEAPPTAGDPRPRALQGL